MHKQRSAGALVQVVSVACQSLTRDSNNAGLMKVFGVSCKSLRLGLRRPAAISSVIFNRNRREDDEAGKGQRQESENITEVQRSKKRRGEEGESQSDPGETTHSTKTGPNQDIASPCSALVFTPRPSMHGERCQQLGGRGSG